MGSNATRTRYVNVRVLLEVTQLTSSFTAEEPDGGGLGLSFCHFLRVIKFDFGSRFNPTVIGPLADIDLGKISIHHAR